MADTTISTNVTSISQRGMPLRNALLFLFSIGIPYYLVQRYTFFLPQHPCGRQKSARRERLVPI